MDYYDIMSPVVKFDSLHVLLAIVNTLDWEIEMTDVKGSYLHSMLQEEIYCICTNLMGLMMDLGRF